MTYTPAEIAALCSDSVVLVLTPGGLGAGFVVDQGRVVTSLHVVKGQSAIKVKAADGIERPVTAVATFDRDDDLAVLLVEGLTLEPLALGGWADLAPGDPVTVIGHPRGLEATVSTGVVAALREDPGGQRLLQITAPISPGSSGGPVLNERGEVVGVVRGLLPNSQALNFATPSSGLGELLRYETAPYHLEQFAAATADPGPHPEPVHQVAAPQPLPAPPPPPAVPRFPEAVVGFTFGMPRSGAQYLCATAAQQRLARLNTSYITELDSSGVWSFCPFMPDPVDFVRGNVALKFAASQLVLIALPGDNWSRVLHRVQLKYGPPAAVEKKGEWVDAPVPKRPTSLLWVLAGGRLILNEKATLFFVSDLSQELELEGF